MLGSFFSAIIRYIFIKGSKAWVNGDIQTEYYSYGMLLIILTVNINSVYAVVVSFKVQSKEVNVIQYTYNKTLCFSQKIHTWICLLLLYQRPSHPFRNGPINSSNPANVNRKLVMGYDVLSRYY